MSGRSATEIEDASPAPSQLECRGEHLALTAPGCYAAFEELILHLAERDGKVVILVDEYDKPLLGQLGQPGVREIQTVLKAFYGVIKTTEAAQRFVLLTGVSKFSKVSIFSDLNNLTDLTMNRSAATLLGYTQGELEANFPDYIAALAVSWANPGRRLSPICATGTTATGSTPNGGDGLQSCLGDEVLPGAEVQELLVRDRHAEFPDRAAQGTSHSPWAI